MDLRGFIEERKPAWRRLEALLEKAERSQFRIGTPEAHELGALYRRASADLCRAQARTANAEVLRYLNDLVARAYGVIYSGRKFRWSDVSWFFLRDFPALVRARWRPLALSTAFVVAGFLTGFIACSLDESAREFLVPENVRDATKQVEQIIQQHQTSAIPAGLAAPLSSFIMTNNIGVCLKAFALGITFGLGTAVALFYNGVLIGVLAAYFHRAQAGVHFWAFILPHGVIELTAIFISGAAGLLVGAALLMPGELTRAQALRRLGGDAVRMVVGCVPLLIVAGTIEGFVTPQGFIPDAAKLAFAGLTALALFVYLAPRSWLSRSFRG